MYQPKITRSLHAVSTLVCQGLSLHLKTLIKKGNNSKNLDLRVMHHALQQHHLFIMNKYFKFGVDTLNTF